MTTFLRRWAAALAGATAFVVTAAFTGAVLAQAASGYAMVYFTESPNGSGNDNALYLAVSPDGRNWQPMNQNNAVAVPTLGTRGLRDPFVMRKQTGGFIVMATDIPEGGNFGAPNQYIHVWDSADLRSFTNERMLRLHTMANTYTWAPEAYWDPHRSQYGIVFSALSTDKTRPVLWVVYTSDFATLSTPQVMYDPGGLGAIDGNMTVVNGVGYLYVKHFGSGRNIGLRSTTMAPGSFTAYTAGVTPGSGYAIEAPQVVPSSTAGTYYLYGDSYAPVNGREYLWVTNNIAADAWTPVSDRDYTQPIGDKHVGIVRLQGSEMANIVARWGAPTWNRLKSYNFPDHYIQHTNFEGRIVRYPTDPMKDAQWRIVPGLADAAGVSFESVTFPGYYLRHSNYLLALAPSDGGTQFRADATFYKVPGLANAGWSSFRSYNVPSMYLRHSNYRLRIDPITNATGQADATFQTVH